ncbi:Glycosyl transferase, group 2 family protein [hydrothermal vent metagenome]|uniref:Glycosyl transferase, group 2 family protein n=1 Tax=hydrothermal vent metagenome TaxID=652676 RepID=A0A3B0V3S5_9ZZZZ
MKTNNSNHSIKDTKVDMAGLDLNAQYQIFLQNSEKPKQYKLKYQPMISIIVPVYNIAAKHLELCIQSVINQGYSHWELHLYDDASTNMDTLECLKKWHKKHKKIHVQYGKTNQGIAHALNQSIAKAKGSFVGILEHGDELNQDALWQVVSCLNQDKSIDFFYSDEDEINENGERLNPCFKSGFNLDALLSFNYINNFVVIRKKYGNKKNWFKNGLDGSQTYDLLLRLLPLKINIRHIPHVLYHKRLSETPAKLSNKDYQDITAKSALDNYIYRNNINATITNGLFENSFRVQRAVDESQLVSIIIPFRDKLDLLQVCMQSLLAITAYPTYEVLLINNQSKDADVLEYCTQLSQDFANIYLHDFDEPFNFSRLNNFAVTKAKGSFLLFLNNDIKIIHHDWLHEMVSHIQRDEVGAVGAKLLYADDTIQHSGMLVSAESAVHFGRNEKDTDIGYFQRANYIQNISVCTGACLMVSKSVFLEVGGFDEEFFKITFNDVDLCLKIRQAGYLIVYTPYAKIYHYESKSRGLDGTPEKLVRFKQEQKHYQRKWAKAYVDGDPYFNPNLQSSVETIVLNQTSR